MLKKLPIGIQTFKRLREENYLYIDKTKEALELIESGSVFYFLSRPRRFGKSLFLDTLAEIFQGSKELFEDLYIYDKYNWSQKYPVIKISWGGKLQTIKDLEDKLKETLLDNQKDLQIKCDDDISLSICLERLIKLAYEKYNTQVAVLIDEYDKPILDVIEDINQAKLHREYIKGLYSILKENERYIKFCFLTGVSKFSKASIFSGLNMLQDISLNPKYGNICGYTQIDIETTILPYLDGVDLERFQNYYNGYYFLKDPVYNPFDTLLFIENGFMYKNYWFESGTPTFLIKLIEQNNYFLPRLSNLIVDERLLDSFDIENIDLEVILYQTGYLTIEEVIEDEDLDSIEYKLKLPNKEVKSSFNNFIINQLFRQKDNIPKQKSLIKTLKSANLEEFKNSLISIFASIPYNNYTKNKIYEYEGFYASVIYVYLQSLGLEIIGEDVTNRGRVDLTIKINDIVYIIEFKLKAQSQKLKANENSALIQLKEKQYHLKYLNSFKHSALGFKLYLVGIEFNKDEKNISSFEWEKINS